VNTKSTKYLLLTGVMLIWGLIIYRVIHGLDRDNDAVIMTSHNEGLKYVALADTFALVANYPDPFLSTQDETAEKENEVLTDQQITPVPVMPTQRKSSIDLHTLHYQGMILNPDTKKKVGILTIDGKQVMVKEQDKIEGFLIRKITKDKITIAVDGKNTEIERDKA
jgi:type II secretory pathway component PulC